MAIAAVAALWWAYFDIVALVAERRLTEAPPGEQAPLARDSYSYIHFPMIAGIVLLALGLKKTELAVDDPLKTIPALALCGGVALYLLAHIAFRLPQRRHPQPPARPRHGGGAGADPAGARGRRPLRGRRGHRGAGGPVAYEAIRFREARERVRANPSATLAEMRGPLTRIRRWGACTCWP